MHKVFVCGPPRSGKTTFSRRLGAELGVPVIHTDDYIGSTSFKDAPDAVIKSLPYSYVVEGVQAARIVRKLIESGLDAKSKVYYLTSNYGRTPNQEPMAIGIRKIWRGLKPQLLQRGVHVEEL